MAQTPQMHTQSDIIETYAYCNGVYGAPEELTVPFLDRALYFGDGVYDATIAGNGVILYEDEHLERFFNSARLMNIEPQLSKQEIHEILQHLVDTCQVDDVFLYWQITRGVAPRNHPFPQDAKQTVMAYVVPCPRVDLSQKTTIHLVEDTRFYHCNAKTINLLPNVLAAQEALDVGMNEAVFVRDGYVTECAHSNVHILKNGTIITHPADNLILPGIARKHIIGMAHALGIPVEERPFTPDELKEADEIIISSSSTFAQGVSEVDGQPAGGKDPKTLEKLQAALTKEFEDYIS